MDKYKKRNVTKKWLQENNFRYSTLFTDDESDAYTYKFPVHKYGTRIIIECEFILYVKNGDVKINVYDCGTHNKYVPFYNREYGYNELVSEIDKRIAEELKRLKINKYKREK